MCFQLHSSLPVRLGGTEAKVATLVSSALLGGGSSWREHTLEAPVASFDARCSSGKNNNLTNPADLCVGIDRPIDTIPMFGLPQLEEAGL